ncbi:MAG: hypothetical protein K1W20_12710 [Lachnospiraceae bacterium]
MGEQNGTLNVVGILDGRYLLVEFSDHNGNVCYFHTDVRVVWMPDGTSLGDFLSREATDEEITAALIN